MAAGRIRSFRWLAWGLGIFLLGATQSAASNSAWAQACAELSQPAPEEFSIVSATSEDTTGWTIQRAHHYVWSTVRDDRSEHFANASSVYLRLITAPLPDLTPDERAIVQCHRRQLALVLPDSLQQRIESPAEERPQLARDLGTWWRAQDPLPATEENERITTHLQRVAHATAEYADEEAATGVDVRGEIHIRLGPPAHATTVRFNASRVLTLIRTSPILSRGDFPDNEYWVYPHVGEHAKYLFVKRGGRWQIGTAFDLVPRFFQVGLSSSERGRERAEGLGILLEEIFSQLGTVDVDYGPWYQEAFDATAVSLSGSMTSRMRQVMTQGREYEAQQAFDREQSVPRTVAAIADASEELPVDVRVARFLDEDGTTRTDIYWAPKPNALYVPGREDDHPAYEAWNRYLLLFAAVQHGPAFEREALHYKRYVLRQTEDGRATIGPQRYTVSGDSERYHLRLQWQQHIARRSATEGMAVGPRVKVQAVRFDSLTALRAAPNALEMSDLRPLKPGPDGAIEGATPYPFSYWNAQEALVLYFEVYHLAFNASDRTAYTVSYEIERKTQRGGIRGWLGGTEEDQTTTTATYTGTTRRATEYIVIDLDDALAEASGTVRITVRVTDETTGQHVERTLTFDLMAGRAGS